MKDLEVDWDDTRLHLTSDFVLQDLMLESLDAKVAEVQRCLVEDRSPGQSTLEKLASVENCMTVVLQSLESMPEESLKMLKKIMDRERRTRCKCLFFFHDSHRWVVNCALTPMFVHHRQREENLREQRLKQEEKLKRYLERSLADCKKMVRSSICLSLTPSLSFSPSLFLFWKASQKLWL